MTPMPRLAFLLALLVVAPALVSLPAEAQEPARCTRVDQARFFWHYQCVKAEFDRIVAAHPKIARYYEIGRTVLDQPIYVLEVANKERQANTSLPRPGFYLDATHHGNEIQGTEAAMILARKVTGEYGKNATVTRWVDDYNIYINPVINPDGNNLNQRQNANGVDLNRNYPFQHGARAANAGPSGASEPETKANVKFMREHDLDVYLSLHTGTWDYVLPRCSTSTNRERVPTDDEPLMNWMIAELLGASGMGSRGASGTGESICWAYDVLEVWSILPEVSTEQSRPFTATETTQLNRAMDGIYYMLERTGRWGSLLNLTLAASPDNSTVVIRVRNDGLQAATNWTLEINYRDSKRSPLLRGNEPIAPNATVQVSVPKSYLQGDVFAKLSYEHLNVNPLVSEPATARPRDPQVSWLNFTAQSAQVLLRGGRERDGAAALDPLIAIVALGAAMAALRRTRE